MQKGELDKVQETLAKRLLTISALSTANIFQEGAKLFETGAGKMCGLSITVKIPIPLCASKYTAGPVFSKLLLQVKIERDASLAKHTPSITTIAESVTKALHLWEFPLECGYGKISLAPQSPWQNLEHETSALSSVLINFNTQSVLG